MSPSDKIQQVKRHIIAVFYEQAGKPEIDGYKALADIYAMLCDDDIDYTGYPANDEINAHNKVCW
jgi:hypothetical protein